ncbi:fimbria/pilus outer membrane usher protein [Ursidibacter arcticus]
MRKIRLNPVAIVCQLYCLLHSSVLFADESETEFDASFLRGNEDLSIDISRFNHKNAFVAGRYTDVEIYVNAEKKGITDLIFIEGEKKATLCLTPHLVEIFDLKPTAYQKQEKQECIDAEVAIPEANLHFDIANLKLELTLPQALTEKRPQGYTSPSLWQDGVPALFVNYNLNHYRSYLPSVGTTSNTYLGLRGGMNFAGWSLVHTGSKSWQTTKAYTDFSSKYESIETYLRKPIAPLKSELTLGDISTSGDLLEGLSLRGVRLVSDDRMLPSALRGYAPVVQGIAKTNASIVIKQNGYTIYQINVPAGPFIIDDLYPSGYGGDLSVEITESNGEKRQFTVPFATLVQLVRPNQLKYQLAYGRYRHGNELYKQNVFQGTLQYGLFNNVSLNAGLSKTENYTAYLAGIGLNTPVGAFIADSTWSDAYFINSKKRYKGYSVRASYSVKLPVTDTYITLATYRYSSREYYNLSDTLVANNSTFIDDRVIQSRLYLRPKSQYQISINQSLGDKWGTLYLTGSTQTYWQSKRKNHQYQVSYANHIGRLNYHLGFSQTRDLEHRKDTAFYLNLSMPLGKQHYAGTSYSQSKHYQSLQANLNGSIGEDNALSYGIGLSTAKQNYRAINANMAYSSTYATFNGNVSQDNQKNRQLSTNLAGALVLHPYGASLTPALGDTFAIVRAKGASGAKINGLYNQQIDMFGNGIMPYLSAYERNYVSINPEELPINVEFSATQKEVIPKAYTAMLVKFETSINPMVLFAVQTDNNQPIPLGAEAFDEDNHLVGYVVQGGQLFASKLDKPKGNITIRWEPTKAGMCTFYYELSTLAVSEELKTYNVQCKQERLNEK